MGNADPGSGTARTTVLGSLLAALVLVAGCGDWQTADEQTMADVRAEEAPDEESWDVSFLVTQVPHDTAASQPRFAVEAGYMARYTRDDTTYTLLRPREGDADGRVTVHLFDDQGDSSAVLRADRIVYFQDDGRFLARGQVVVQTQDDVRLETETLEWVERTRRVHTPGFVRITTPAEQIRGYRLDADEDLDTYRLAEVTGRVEVEEDA